MVFDAPVAEVAEEEGSFGCYLYRDGAMLLYESQERLSIAEMGSRNIL